MIKIFVQSMDFSNRIGFFVCEVDSLGRITHLAQQLDFVMHEYHEGQMTSPTIELPHRIAQEFMKSFAEALDSQGIKTENDHKIAGTLEATRHHLADLRQLLKLKS